MEGIILEVPKNKVRICIVYVWYFAETGRFVAVPGELLCDMMMSSNGNIFRVTDPLWGESTGDRWIPPHKSQWSGDSMFSFICAWTNSWANNRNAGDLRHHRAP